MGFEGWAPVGGLEGRGGVKGGEEVGAPWTAQNFALFPSPKSIFDVFLSLWGLLVSFFLSLGVFLCGGPCEYPGKERTIVGTNKCQSSSSGKSLRYEIRGQVPRRD